MTTKQEGNCGLAPAGEAAPAGRPLEATTTGNRGAVRRLGPRSSPDSVKRFVRRCLAKALPQISEKLIAKAIEGGLEELKALVQLSGLDIKAPVLKKLKKPTGRTLEQMLLYDVRKEPADGAGIKQ